MKLLKRLDISFEELLLGVAFFLSSAYFWHGGQHNEAARFDQLRAVWEQGTLAINTFAYNSADVVEINNQIFPNKPPGSVLISIIPWGFWSILLNQFPINFIGNEFKYETICYLTNLSTVCLFSSLLVVLVTRFIRVKYSASTANLIGFGITFGSILLPFSTVFLPIIWPLFLPFLAFI